MKPTNAKTKQQLLKSGLGGMLFHTICNKNVFFIKT
jgi:hypothetical protein